MKKDKQNKINESYAFICVKCIFSPNAWLAHANTTKHQNNILGIEKINNYHCEYCNMTCQYNDTWNKHINFFIIYNYLKHFLYNNI